MRTDRRRRDFLAVAAAGAKLERLGWMPAALELRRTRSARPSGYPGTLFQEIYLSRGRDYVNIGIRPDSRASRVSLKTPASRSCVTRLRKRLLELGYRPTAWDVKVSGLVYARRFSKSRSIEGDWSAAIESIRSKQMVMTGPAAAKVYPLPRMHVSLRGTRTNILRGLRRLSRTRIHPWRPEYLLYRRIRRFWASGLPWRLNDDLLFYDAGVDLSRWFFADLKRSARGWRGKAPGTFLGRVAEEMRGRGFISTTGPNRHGRMIYLGLDRRPLSLKSLYQEAKLLSTWSPPR